jgi:hypothetical protein
MKQFLCVVGGALIGIIAASLMTSHVYKLQLNQPKLSCEIVQPKKVSGVEHRIKPVYDTNSFEHKVKRTE